MIEGFYTRAELEVVKAPQSLLPQCGACGLYRSCNSPKMPPSSGSKRILIVGDFPGQEDDTQGKHFAGESGKYLRDKIRKCGLDPNKEVSYTNALICHPKHNKVTDPRMIEYCRPNIIDTIERLKPEVIIPLGQKAIESVVGWLWKEKVGEESKWIGWAIPSQRLNAWVVPNYHPSYMIRMNNKLYDMHFMDTLKKALGKTARPWKTVPDFRKKVQIVINEKEAAKEIRLMMAFGKPLAFDYETNMLKPDSASASIVSCALSDGQTAIAFPMQGEAQEALKTVLESGLPMIAANLKFEQRWTMAKLKTRVKKWHFDTVLGSHVLDERQGTAGVKFQSFVRLGQESYDDHIKPYLQAKRSNTPNRIRQIPIDELLMYNGLDALLEYKLTQLHRKELDLP